MEAGITDSDRTAMVRAAVASVDRDELKTALSMAADPRYPGAQRGDQCRQCPAQAP